MPKEAKRRSGACWGKCHICDTIKTVWWEQRGITNKEWIRACADCQHKIYKQNRRHPAPKRQLDLFAK